MLLKKRIVNLVIAVALLTAIVGGSGIVADEVGLAVTSQAHAETCSGGGGC